MRSQNSALCRSVCCLSRGLGEVISLPEGWVTTRHSTSASQVEKEAFAHRTLRLRAFPARTLRARSIQSIRRSLVYVFVQDFQRREGSRMNAD